MTTPADLFLRKRHRRHLLQAPPAADDRMGAGPYNRNEQHVGAVLGQFYYDYYGKSALVVPVVVFVVVVSSLNKDDDEDDDIDAVGCHEPRSLCWTVLDSRSEDDPSARRHFDHSCQQWTRVRCSAGQFPINKT